MNRIYSHIRSGKLYELVGIARCAKNPNIKRVVYKQLYESNLRSPTSEVTDVKLEHGALWTRTERDFKTKFKLMDEAKTSSIYDNISSGLETVGAGLEVINTVVQVVDVTSDIAAKVVKSIDDLT